MLLLLGYSGRGHLEIKKIPPWAILPTVSSLNILVRFRDITLSDII